MSGAVYGRIEGVGHMRIRDYQFVVESYIDGQWRIVTHIPLAVALSIGQLHPFDPEHKNDLAFKYPTRYYFVKKKKGNDYNACC